MTKTLNGRDPQRKQMVSGVPDFVVKRKRKRWAVDPCLGFYMLSVVSSSPPQVPNVAQGIETLSASKVEQEPLQSLLPLSLNDTNELSAKSLGGMSSLGTPTTLSTPLQTVEDFLRQTSKSTACLKKYTRRRLHNKPESHCPNPTVIRHLGSDSNVMQLRSRKIYKPNVDATDSGSEDSKDGNGVHISRRKKRPALAERLFNAAVMSYGDPVDSLISPNSGSDDTDRKPLHFIPNINHETPNLLKCRWSMVNPKKTAPFRTSVFSASKNVQLTNSRPLTEGIKLIDAPLKKIGAAININLPKHQKTIKPSHRPPLVFVPVKEAVSSRPRHRCRIAFRKIESSPSPNAYKAIPSAQFGHIHSTPTLLMSSATTEDILVPCVSTISSPDIVSTVTITQQKDSRSLSRFSDFASSYSKTQASKIWNKKHADMLMEENVTTSPIGSRKGHSHPILLRNDHIPYTKRMNLQPNKVQKDPGKALKPIASLLNGFMETARSIHRSMPDELLTIQPRNQSSLQGKVSIPYATTTSRSNHSLRRLRTVILSNSQTPIRPSFRNTAQSGEQGRGNTALTRSISHGSTRLLATPALSVKESAYITPKWKPIRCSLVPSSCNSNLSLDFDCDAMSSPNYDMATMQIS